MKGGMVYSFFSWLFFSHFAFSSCVFFHSFRERFLRRLRHFTIQSFSETTRLEVIQDNRLRQAPKNDQVKHVRLRKKRGTANMTG
jgi:hypothetical protein